MKETTRQSCIRFCSYHGIEVSKTNAKGLNKGIVAVINGKPEVFANWHELKDALIAWRNGVQS